MSLQDRFDAAIRIIEEHNKQLPERSPGVTHEAAVNVDAFVDCIKAMGGTTEERLSKLMWEDVLYCLPVTNGIKPVPLAKDLVKALRGNATVENEASGKFIGPVSAKKADKMTAFELISAYDPNEPDNAVGARLKNASRGEPFIVFNDEGNVNVERSLYLLNEIKKGFPGRELYSADGVDRQVYKVGQRPDDYADENPIYHGRPLRPDGTCDQTNRSWEGVLLEVRQLVWLAVCEESASTLAAAHDIMDMAVGVDAIKVLRQRFRKASLKYNELAKIGNLPKLKVPLAVSEGRPAQGGSPFR